MAPSPSRLRVAVLYGGRSAEHDVSVLSATNVIGALDAAKYEALPIFVTREGLWLLSSFDGGTLAKPESGTEVALVPGKGGMLPLLLALLQDENPWVRHEAALALDAMGGGEGFAYARPALEAATKDKNQYVVRVVTHALKARE